jgi:hypothetical protein
MKYLKVIHVLRASFVDSSTGVAYYDVSDANSE